MYSCSYSPDAHHASYLNWCHNAYHFPWQIFHSVGMYNLWKFPWQLKFHLQSFTYWAVKVSFHRNQSSLRTCQSSEMALEPWSDLHQPIVLAFSLPAKSVLYGWIDTVLQIKKLFPRVWMAEHGQIINLVLRTNGLHQFSPFFMAFASHYNNTYFHFFGFWQRQI